MTVQGNSPPRQLESNPGQASILRVTVSDGVKEEIETINLIEQLERLFHEKQFAVVNHKSWLELPDSGFLLVPMIAEFNPQDDGRFHTLTTIQIHHPELVPDGVFEYQHSWGDTIAEATYRGFEKWFPVDFLTFQGALLPRPQSCMTMEITFSPGAQGLAEHRRRVVFGPVEHYRTNPESHSAKVKGKEHPFCPCCLFTNSLEAFTELLQGNDFLAIRFFAARNGEGLPEADCRLNGEDCLPGMAALKKYVTTWDGSGYEYRKQYVLVQTLAAPASTDMQMVWTKKPS